MVLGSRLSRSSRAELGRTWKGRPEVTEEPRMRNYGGATYLVLPDGAAILGIPGLLRPLRSLLSLLALSPFALSLPLLFLVVLGSHIDDYALFSSHLFASSIDIYTRAYVVPSRRENTTTAPVALFKVNRRRDNGYTAMMTTTMTTISDGYALSRWCGAGARDYGN